MGQTDGRTDIRPLHVPRSVYYVGSASKVKKPQKRFNSHQLYHVNRYNTLLNLSCLGLCTSGIAISSSSCLCCVQSGRSQLRKLSAGRSRGSAGFRLPSVKMAVRKKSGKRCNICGKKTRLGNGFQCRYCTCCDYLVVLMNSRIICYFSLP